MNPKRPLSVDLSPQAHEALEHLVQTGLFGKTKKAAAEELIYLGLREIITAGRFAALIEKR